MSLFGFGKRVKHQRFDYIPRYWDPAKEDLENRLSSKKDIPDAELAKRRIQQGFTRKTGANKELGKKVNKQSNVRLFIIIIVLFLLAYLMLKSDSLLRMMESIESIESAG